MPFEIIRNDITKMQVDAIVNAANNRLQQGGGVCGAIFAAAGAMELQRACDQIGVCGVGEAVITGGFQLPAKYIIHTVGPIWQGGNHNEEKLLRSAYANSLKLAQQNQCVSVAFPLISSGIYGYPMEQAFQIAVSEVSNFLMRHEMTVYLIVFGRNAMTISEKLFAKIEQYIDDNYTEDTRIMESRRRIEVFESQTLQTKVLDSLAAPVMGVAKPSSRKRNLEDVISQLDETFSQMLLRLIDEKGSTDIKIYKKANVDRKLFSKIRSNKDYNPKKVTALAFAIALELNLDETLDLLRKAGYSLSNSSKFDVIIQYFIEDKNYDVYLINQALFTYDQNLLGA